MKVCLVEQPKARTRRSPEGVPARTQAARLCRRPQLGSKRIYDFQKLELIEIGIPSADENCRVRAMQQITREVW
jgi:hypothetical protein